MHFTAHSLDHTRRELFYDSCLSGASFTRRNPIAVAIEMLEILQPARWHIAYSFRLKLINEGERRRRHFERFKYSSLRRSSFDFGFQQRPRSKRRKPVDADILVFSIEHLGHRSMPDTKAKQSKPESSSNASSSRSGTENFSAIGNQSNASSMNKHLLSTSAPAGGNIQKSFSLGNDLIQKSFEFSFFF